MRAHSPFWNGSWNLGGQSGAVGLEPGSPGSFFLFALFWVNERGHVLTFDGPYQLLISFKSVFCPYPFSFFFAFYFHPLYAKRDTSSRISYTNLKIKKIPYPESVVAFRVSSAFCLLLCSICELNSILVLGPFAVFLFPSFLRRPRHETQTD